MTVDQEPQEPRVKKKKLKVRSNLWKTDQVTGELEVSSGPPPTLKESPPIDPETGKPVKFQEDFMDIVDRVERDNKKSQG
jgi:hypothetical protein